MSDDRSLHAAGGSSKWTPGMIAQRVILGLFRPRLWPCARVTISGIEHLPRSGPVVLVANHRSYFDAVLLGMILNTHWRPFRILGKKSLFGVPLLGAAMRACGGIPVDRSGGAADAMAGAASALEDGDILVMFPQGSVPRGRKFFDPVLVGKTGSVRLAALTGAPVVPVGVWGTEQVWPRSSRLPKLFPFRGRPHTSANIGPAVAISGADARADTATVMAAIVDLLPPQARIAYEPTAAEIATTYPPSETPPSE